MAFVVLFVWPLYLDPLFFTGSGLFSVKTETLQCLQSIVIDGLGEAQHSIVLSEMKFSKYESQFIIVGRHLQKETNLGSAQMIVRKRFECRPRWPKIGSHETLRCFSVE